VSGHFGNWELLGAAVASRGYTVRLVIAEMRNAAFRDLMNRYQGLFSVRPLARREEGPREALRSLSRGEVVGLLYDQRPARDTVSAPFFGRRVPFVRGPAFLSRLSGAPIVPAFAERVGGSTHRFRVHPPLRPPATRAEEEATMAELAALLEQAVRRRPDQWLWLHKRWKGHPAETEVTR
jgi:KDO2-lipid IV(A) lauroyltransferase